MGSLTDRIRTRRELTIDRIARAKEALERNLGTITEQDWRDMIASDEALLAKLEGRAV